MKRTVIIITSILILSLSLTYLLRQKDDLQGTKPFDDQHQKQAEQPINPPAQAAAQGGQSAPSQEPRADNDILKPITSESPEEFYKHPHRHLVAVQVDGHWVAQNDLLVREHDFVPGVEGRRLRLFKIPESTRWPTNRIPFVIDSSLDASAILAAVEMFQMTNITFVERIDETDYVVFRRNDKGQCLSYLGHQGGEQDIFIDPKTCMAGNVAHEMMHTLGFVHEHSRADRDDFVTVHWENIERVQYPQFQKIDAEASLVALGPFDFDSVLLYASDAFSLGGHPSLTLKNGGRYNVNRGRLSDIDIQKINKLYPDEKGN